MFNLVLITKQLQYVQCNFINYEIAYTVTGQKSHIVRLIMQLKVLSATVII